MIKVENIDIFGWEAAIRGMRNPMNSWERSDSLFIDSDGDFYDICGNIRPSNEELIEPDFSCMNLQGIGDNDHELMMKLAKGGAVHAKYRRMIHVQMDITAPLYWWKEFDTYKVGTVANSCSTMHKIHEKKFELDDFSHDHLSLYAIQVHLKSIIRYLNDLRYCYINFDELRENEEFLSELYFRFGAGEIGKKDIWYQMIQLLPSSYNQKRTVDLNYETLYSIYKWRNNHKLDEWVDFCKELEKLPYSEIFTLEVEENE